MDKEDLIYEKIKNLCDYHNLKSTLFVEKWLRTTLRKRKIKKIFNL